jgi:hypothetical protein
MITLLIEFLSNVVDITKKRLFAGGAIKIVSAIVIRPADTNQYALNDVVANSTSVPEIMAFPGAARVAGCGGRITGAKLSKNSAGVTNATFRLYLYNDAIAAIADNAAHTLLAANTAKRVGWIDFSLLTSGAGSDCAEDIQQGLNLEFVTQNGTESLYGILVTGGVGTYIPVAGEKFTAELRVEQY